MARKPQPNRSVSTDRRSQEGSFDNVSFVNGVFNDEYILVIGSGVILDRKQFLDTDGDINRYILNILNEERREKRGEEFVNHQSFTDIFMGTARDEVDPIYDLLANGYEYPIEEISPELRQLLETKLFKFVLTTTIDNYVEVLMRKIWGTELRIVNIEDSQSLKDFQTALAESRVNKYVQPTLFYVFGKVIPGKQRPRTFVETDIDAVKVIEKWMKLENGKDIVPFLKEKRFLALGCKFDDWYFRFFWYILTRRFGYDDSENTSTSSDILAVQLNQNLPSDYSLFEYLKRIGVCLHADVWQFMNHIHELLTSTGVDSPYRNMILNKRRQGGVFISYHSPDVNAAGEIFCKLTGEGKLNVWFDNIKLHGGDDYSLEIQRAIAQSRVFIPILSPHVAEDLVNEGVGISTFYSKEWRWAADSQAVIIPLAIDGYNLRGEAHVLFEKIIGRDTRTTGIDMQAKPTNNRIQEKVGFAKLLESIEIHLNIR